jgi:hypothetical protein
MDLYEIVMKLNGQIQPVGSHDIDLQRFINLNELVNLVELLITELSRASENHKSYEASVKKIGCEAKDALFDVFQSLYLEFNEKIERETE